MSCAVPPQRLLRLLAAVAIVLGILGMHALTLHATGGSHAPTHPAAATEHPPASSAVPVAGERPSHGPGEMMMLCAAMLAATAAGCLVLVLLRRVPRAAWRVSRPRLTSLLPRLVPVPGGTGPPEVWAFSVIRC